MSRFAPRSPSHARRALLPLACILPFSTPALAEEVAPLDPELRPVTVYPPNPDLVSRWQVHSDSPWAPYEKSTLLGALNAGRPLILPDVRRLEVVQYAIEAASTVAAAGLPSDTMWVVDLRGAASVAFAATLSRRAHEPVVPVLTFNNWPADNEMVPAEEALSALTVWQPSPASAAVDARPVFVLDAWRLSFPTAAVDDEVTDNRYMLTQADLPDPTALARQGIGRVMYLVESREDSPFEEDDLNATFLEYEAAGIELVLVDLDDLCYAPDEAEFAESHGALTVGWSPWTTWARHFAYVPAARPTMVNDPLFYGRARGGFGVMATAWSAHAAIGHGHGGG